MERKKEQETEMERKKEQETEMETERGCLPLNSTAIFYSLYCLLWRPASASKNGKDQTPPFARRGNNNMLRAEGAGAGREGGAKQAAKQAPASCCFSTPSMVLRTYIDME